jgi:ribonuclease BN (tRNA processing enzyme)
MEVTFLGTGSAMPTGKRAQTGILLGADRPLLVDCGSGVLDRLARTEVGYEGVDSVLLTHHHIDHVSDLPALLKARWLAGETSLSVAGPPGTRELVEGLLELHEYMQGRVDLDIREVEGDQRFEFAGFDVRSHEVVHSMYCLAYRFEADGQAFVFSADTEARSELCAFADGAAVLAHDCSFPDEVDVSNHPTPESLGRALAEADPSIGRVYLTHLYPHVDGHREEMRSSVRDRYDGDVEFARDGLGVDLSDLE